MASAAQITTWIAEAEAARHSLAMGNVVKSIWRDGRRVEYSAGGLSLTQIDDYIERLNRELIAATATEAGSTSKRGSRVRTVRFA